MSDALPLPPRPDLDQYRKLAKDLKRACESGDDGAIREWAGRWITALARLRNETVPTEIERAINRDALSIERRWREWRKKESTDTCRLTDAQFMIARWHGFESWP